MDLFVVCVMSRFPVSLPTSTVASFCSLPSPLLPVRSLQSLKFFLGHQNSRVRSPSLNRTGLLSPTRPWRTISRRMITMWTTVRGRSGLRTPGSTIHLVTVLLPNHWMEFRCCPSGLERCLVWILRLKTSPGSVRRNSPNSFDAMSVLMCHFSHCHTGCYSNNNNNKTTICSQVHSRTDEMLFITTDSLFHKLSTVFRHPCSDFMDSRIQIVVYYYY